LIRIDTRELAISQSLSAFNYLQQIQQTFAQTEAELKAIAQVQQYVMPFCDIVSNIGKL
jgi:hypothetical protein